MPDASGFKDFNVETKEQETDVFSLPSLIAWLEKQPGEMRYNWHSCNACLFYAYLVAHQKTGKTPWSEFGDRIKPGMDLFASVVSSIKTYWAIAAVQPFTYGAALLRARAALSRASK